MLNISDYCISESIWNGIVSYIQDHIDNYQCVLTNSFTDDDLLQMLKNNAKAVLPAKEYDTFRKSITALKKGTANSLKRENLYRLCYALSLASDTQAQDLFLNHLHQNELSARSLEEFIVIASLKIRLSWEEMDKIRKHYRAQIVSLPISPDTLEEGHTAEVYNTILNDQLYTKKDLVCFLEDPQNLSFFAHTRNTQYLALFDDVELELLYNDKQEQIIQLVTNYGNSEKETIREYYDSLFGLQDDNSEDSLSSDEIASLCRKFEHIFITYDNFCQLVQRKRPIEIPSGMFMLNLLKKLLTEENDLENDFYVDFTDPDEFIDVCNDILIYFGFPVFNPACDNFDQLLLDIYYETLAENPSASNSRFQKLYMQNLRHYLRQIAKV